LLKCVAEAQDKELTIVLIRAGKEQALKVVPAKRPQANAEAVKETVAEEREAIRSLESALNQYRRKTDVAEAIDVLRLRPGVVSGGSSAQGGLPKDVSVSITKEGSSPAKILVKKDGKEYQTTEDKLGELPTEIQKLVQIVRGNSGNLWAYRLTNPKIAPSVVNQYVAPSVKLPVPVPPTHAVNPGVSPDPVKVYRYRQVETKASGDVDSKLNQILKILGHQGDSDVSSLRNEVDQLRKEIEELRKEKK